MPQLLRRDFLLTSAASLAAAPLLLSQDKKPDPYADAVLLDGEPPLPDTGSFTVVLLPDTQNYSEKYPATYLAQTRWIVEQKARRNIAAVLHLGDITNHSTEAEWKNAQQAMKQLDGHVPYFVCPGNHDYSAGGSCKDRTTLLNDYFPHSDYSTRPHFGGVYDKEPTRMENNYHTFSAGGRDFLVLALEFGPRKDVVRWANGVVGKHPRHEVILITHAFIYSDDTRYSWKTYGEKQKWNPHAYPVAKNTGDDVTDGEELWDLLISKHENFILTFNGHVLHDGLGQFRSTTPGGRVVPQVLVNYQMRPQGGDGWLRLLEFKPDRKTIEVYDYSPTRKQRNEGKENRFAMVTAAVSHRGK
ncbi:MAG: metallophosphoesterase [Gemmatales bacterium]